MTKILNTETTTAMADATPAPVKPKVRTRKPRPVKGDAQAAEDGPTPADVVAATHATVTPLAAAHATPAPALVQTTKSATVIEALHGTAGLSLDAIMTMTGWQAHSVRGFLSGTVRKKLGLTLEKIQQSEGTCHYRIIVPTVPLRVAATRMLASTTMETAVEASAAQKRDGDADASGDVSGDTSRHTGSDTSTSDLRRLERPRVRRAARSSLGPVMATTPMLSSSMTAA